MYVGFFCSLYVAFSVSLCVCKYAAFSISTYVDFNSRLHVCLKCLCVAVHVKLYLAFNVSLSIGYFQGHSVCMSI